MQSEEWSKFQESLGREVIYESDDGWQWVASIRRSKGLNYILCSYGPAADDPKAMKAALNSLLAACREADCDFIRVEPQKHATPAVLTGLGGIRISDFEPAHTRILDLTKSEEELRSALSSGHRNLINGTERRGIKIRQETTPATLALFDAMLRDTARHSGVTFFGGDYYRKMYDAFSEKLNLRIYIADAEGAPVSSAIFYDWGDTRYYGHAGAFQERNREVKASVSLVWQAIVDAKISGKKKFDLWGVAPEGDESHPLAGISKFKGAFGGEIVDYGGTWDIPVKKFKYKLYGYYRKLRGRS